MDLINLHFISTFCLKEEEKGSHVNHDVIQIGLQCCRRKEIVLFLFFSLIDYHCYSI